MELPEDYIEIKADVFRVVRANADKPAKTVLSLIHEHLPDVDKEVLKQILSEFCERKL